MKFVYVCSPLRGDIETNIRRAYGYCRFVIQQGALPLAPHAIFTAFLDDTIPEERQLGMSLGIELLKRSDELWVFGKRITEGMRAEIEVAIERNIPVQYFDERCEKRYPHAEP
ncbi:hypothetical protein EV210_10690 [Anaerospora hongkongensis]|uniref:DUF7768 domain-containing protein n=1 Tax=Anaerospora hongkongensis TaxID=244830 RepID=A0A4R1PZT5_9FIRM|nr:DUF4406 domain-containing protein [Anaerospora hongkongensis]TCL37223.1 hypothetical protein EV210_10690 [Anaerospora hongkongensis]